MTASNPFKPQAAPAPAEAAAPAAPVEVTDAVEKKDRKTPAKQLSEEQKKEIVQRAFSGETPAQIAAAMGIERNQSYRIVKTFKDMGQAMIDDPATPADVKAAVQANLDRIPKREFGATGGATRQSATKATLEDLLTAAV